MSSEHYASKPKTVDRLVQDARLILALTNTVSFLVVSVLIIIMLWVLKGLDAAAAGLLGVIVGYWAGKASAPDGYYFGSSQSNKENRETIDKMLDTQSTTAKALAEKVPTPVLAPADVKIVNDSPVDVTVVKQ